MKETSKNFKGKQGENTAGVKKGNVPAQRKIVIAHYTLAVSLYFLYKYMYMLNAGIIDIKTL